MANNFWTSANVDPKRKYRFIVELAGQGGIGSVWFAKTVDKPEITVGTGEVDFMQHKFYYPGRVEWNEIGLTLVDPSKVMSGISCFIDTNLSPSPISTGADSINDVIAEPSSSYPVS